MTESQRLQIKASTERSRLNELAGLDTLTDDQRTELDGLTVAYSDTERQLRAALTAEAAQGDKVEVHATETLDAEDRQRIELRRKASLGGYLLARLQGRLPAGELAEYQSACGCEDGGIPLDLFEADRPETHADAVTPSPAAGSGAGLNVGPITPWIFDGSIASKLGIAMPQVGTGTWSEMAISTPATAGARVKGAAQSSTAGALTPVSANPRSISARLSLTMEDIAQVGQPRFESALRANLQGAYVDAYDGQCLNGNGTAPNIMGLLAQLDTPTAPTDVVTWDSYLSTITAFAGSKYSEELSDLMVVVPPDAYRLSATTFRDRVIDASGKAAVSLGDMSAQKYLKSVLAGWSGATRLPNAPASGDEANVSIGIVRRMGRGSARAAVHPVWNSISIDDVYTDSASATRHFTLHTLVGDKLMLIRPKGEVYDKVSFKVA